MIRVHITAEAYAAFMANATEPKSPPQRSKSGGYFLWLPEPVHAQLEQYRDWTESLSDTIIRLVASQEAPTPK